MKKTTKPKIEYDKDSKVLSVLLGKQRSANSDVAGNVVIDYDRGGNVVRVNFYDFSFDSFRSGTKALKDFAGRSKTLVPA